MSQTFANGNLSTMATFFVRADKKIQTSIVHVSGRFH